jgi:hypothetical protein
MTNTLINSQGIFLTSLVLALAACSPVKLYDGPDLPKEQIAIVKGNNISINGKSWNQRWNSEAQVKAGLLNIECNTSFADKAVSCSTSSEYDYLAESNCEDRQEREIKEHGASISNCNNCNFYKMIQTCTVPTYYAKCQAQINISGMSENVITCGRDRDPLSAYSDTLYSASMYLNGTPILGKNNSKICTIEGPKNEIVTDNCDSCAVVNKCPQR